MLKNTSSTTDTDSRSHAKHRSGRKEGRGDTKAKGVRASTKQIHWFVKQIFGARTVLYQSYAPKDKKKDPPHAPLWTYERQSLALSRFLGSISEAGMNVGVVPNVMDGNGRKTENCIEIRSLFADFDKGVHTRESLLKLPVPPTYIVETSPGKFHVYWRVEGCTVEQFSEVQKAIAATLGSDPSVSDPSRCMRLPGTLNNNYDPPVRANVVFPSKGERRGHRIKIDEFIATMGLDVQEGKGNAKISGKADDGSHTDEQILELLARIDPTDRDTWRKVGQALFSRYPSRDGRHIWDRWAEGCASKYNIERQREEWATFTDDGGITIGTLVHLAKAGRHDVIVPSTEGELAVAIASYGRDHIRFGTVGQSWWAYEGGIWVESAKGGHSALMYARKLLVRLMSESDVLAKTASLRIALLRGAVGLAQTDPLLQIDDSLFDSDPYLLAVKNGVIDLRTGAFRAATPDDLLTKQANVVFDPSADCPIFRKTLDEICKGRTDLRKYILRLMGYTLTGLAAEEKLFILRGKARNGKGTLMNLLKRLLGSYAVSAAPTLFTKAYKGNPHLATTALVPLRGARLIICTELKKEKLDEEFVKQLSGGDNLMGRGLYASHGEFTPVGKVWLSTNEEPDISIGADAMWHRIVVLPFDASFTGEKMDTTLKEALAEEVSGVLNLMVKAAGEYLEARDEPKGADGRQPTGLRDSKTVAEATSAMRLRSDTVMAWKRECCDAREGAFAQASLAHKSYCSFTVKNGRAALGPVAFKQALNDKGHPSEPRRSGNNGFHGLRLRDLPGK